MKSVELFAGADGLAMGISSAGFQHLEIVECDQWCCETINDNRERSVSPVADWPVVTPIDVKDARFDQLSTDIALVSGGGLPASRSRSEGSTGVTPTAATCSPTWSGRCGPCARAP